MKCPSCASTKIHTYDTRRIEDKVVRKRRCTECDERFYTLEKYMSEDELEEIQELRRSNANKVLHRMSDDAGRDRGDDETDGEDNEMGVHKLSEEAQPESVREGENQ
jgi:transcriptional regulator NrdR family protein